MTAEDIPIEAIELKAELTETRLAGSLKFGHATASLLVGKLSASGRQNALAAAVEEYPAMRRTVYACWYLTDPDYRRRDRGRYRRRAGRARPDWLPAAARLRHPLPIMDEGVALLIGACARAH